MIGEEYGILRMESGKEGYIVKMSTVPLAMHDLNGRPLAFF